MNLKIEAETKEALILTYNKYLDDCKYVLYGLNDLFNFERISETSLTNIVLDKSFGYKKVKVCAFINYDGKDILACESNIIDIPNSNNIRSDLIVKMIKSYKGVTIGIVSNEIYQKYRLYEVSDHNKTLLIESEDFQINLDSYDENKLYCIECYKKNNFNEYILSNTTENFKIKCSSVKMKKPKVSVVIPCFNGEKFLARAVDSVILNSFDSLEIIIVDDGSFDNTNMIADFYKDTYPFIKVIHQENTGLCGARNAGIDIASGEYVALLDADDLVSFNMYELLYNYAIETGSDIAISKTLIRDNISEYSYTLDFDTPNHEYASYTYDEMITKYENYDYDNIYFVAVWNKIVKKELLNNIKFPKSNFYEDNAYTPALYSYCERFVYVQNALYIWEKRNRVTTGTYSTSYNSIPYSKTLEAFFDANVNPPKIGNKKRKKILEYFAVRDVVNYLYDNKTLSNEAFLDYKERVFEYIKDTDIMNYDRLKNNTELSEKIKTLFF